MQEVHKLNIHTFGDGNNPVMILVHGVLTPWQIWMEQVQYFSDKYYVLVPELDGHTENEISEFVSVEDEAIKIVNYCIENNLPNIAVLCGLSMGGAVSYNIWKNQKLDIEHLVLDGAPLIPSGSIIEKFMEKSYLKIIEKSKKRDPKTLENFKRDFLPEKHLDNYLQIADRMSNTSMYNIISSVCKSNIQDGIVSDTKILYIHGTKGNEILSKKSAARMKTYYPDIKIICCKGDMHCQKALFEPQKWINMVDGFLN